MKTQIVTILLLAMHAVTMAQGSARKETEIEKDQKLTFLKEMNIHIDESDTSSTQEFSLILKKGMNYAFHLSNPSTSINNMKLIVKKGVERQLIKTKTEVNTTENYSISRLKANETGAYYLYIEFDKHSANKNATLVLYLDFNKKK